MSYLFKQLGHQDSDLINQLLDCFAIVVDEEKPREDVLHFDIPVVGYDQ